MSSCPDENEPFPDSQVPRTQQIEENDPFLDSQLPETEQIEKNEPLPDFKLPETQQIEDATPVSSAKSNLCSLIQELGCGCPDWMPTIVRYKHHDSIRPLQLDHVTPELCADIDLRTPNFHSNRIIAKLIADVEGKETIILECVDKLKNADHGDLEWLKPHKAEMDKFLKFADGCIEILRENIRNTHDGEPPQNETEIVDRYKLLDDMYNNLKKNIIPDAVLEARRVLPSEASDSKMSTTVKKRRTEKGSDL